MITQVTIGCDWPGCDATLTCPPSGYSDHDWEGRGDRYHVCPTHRFKTAAELDAELDKPRRREEYERLKAEFEPPARPRE